MTVEDGLDHAGLQKKSAAEDQYFLLHCWQEDSDGASGELVWRYSLITRSPGPTRRAFTDLAEAAAYIRASLQQASSSSASQATRRAGRPVSRPLRGSG